MATTQPDCPSEDQVKSWVNAAYQSHFSFSSSSINTSHELTVRLVDADEMIALNQTYRNKDGPTNVLSFEFDAPVATEISLLGDIVICAPVVLTEAKEQNKSLMAHWAHMAVHGTLHLLGYDHQNDEEAVVMEAKETEILKHLGYADPFKEYEL